MKSRSAIGLEPVKTGLFDVGCGIGPPELGQDMVSTRIGGMAWTAPL